MILYTPVPSEVVLDGFFVQAPTPVEVRVGEAILLVEDLGGGWGRVVRLISGNPYDYLKPDWMPGMMIRLS